MRGSFTWRYAGDSFRERKKAVVLIDGWFLVKVASRHGGFSSGVPLNKPPTIDRVGSAQSVTYQEYLLKNHKRSRVKVSNCLVVNTFKQREREEG